MLTQHRRPASEPEFEFESGSRAGASGVPNAGTVHYNSLDRWRYTFLKQYSSSSRGPFIFPCISFLFLLLFALNLFMSYRGTGSMHRRQDTLLYTLQASVYDPTQDRSPEGTRACAGT